MNRREATGVLREIMNECEELISMDFVSITDSDAQIRMKSKGFEIYIKCVPCNDLNQCLTPILLKRKLRMAQVKEGIIVYKPKID